MKGYLKCSKSEFPTIDMFIHSLEFVAKPDVDELTLMVLFDKIYQYRIEKVGDKFYFTTN